CILWHSIPCPAPLPTLFPYTTLFRSSGPSGPRGRAGLPAGWRLEACRNRGLCPRKSTVPPRLFDSLRLGVADVGGRNRRMDRERSEEHTSELQSPDHLVCRPLLEKKK